MLAMTAVVMVSSAVMMTTVVLLGRRRRPVRPAVGPLRCAGGRIA
jgi:hypothetical protein